MPKFVVDPDTLGYVARALSALSAEFEGIARMTNDLQPAEVGGASVLRHLEQFDDSWIYGRTIIDEEIVGMSHRLETAREVYTLIEARVAAGARGTIDLGRWGVAHLGAPGGHAGAGGGGHRSGTGTTTIGGGGHRSGTGTTTIGGGSAPPGGHRSGTGTTRIGDTQQVAPHSGLLTG
jgi:hypothetical protein